MFEFFITIFALYILYKIVRAVFVIMGATMAAMIFIIVVCLTIVVTTLNVVVQLYAKALGANTIITIGVTCVAFVLVTH